MATVKKNIYWSSLVSLIQVYTGSIVFIILAKLMSIDDFGILSFGFSLSAIVLIFSDFGFSLMLMKDYPLVQQKHIYIANTLLLKIIISVFCTILFAFYLLIFYSEEWVIVGAVYVLFAIVASFTGYLQALLRIQNKFNKYTETTIIYAVTVTIIIIWYYFFSLNLIQIVLGFLMGKSIQLIWSLLICKEYLVGDFTLNKKLLKGLINKSWSFAGHSILGVLYFMVDTQLISYFLGAKEVALYQSVFRILLILVMISEMISNVLLPYLSYKFIKSENISYLVSNFFLFLLVLSCSMFLIFTSFKYEIVINLYTEEYLNALPLVLPLAIVLIFRTTASVFGNVLTVSDNQKFRVITVFISLIVSIIFNFILIPIYGIVISAWVSVFVHLILFSLYYYFSKKELPQISIINSDTVQAIIVTLLIYLIIHVVIDNHFFGVLFGVILWVMYLYLFFIKKGNWNKLRLILNDNGI